MDQTLKRASWLELFFDLAFVALVAQLTYLAARYHHTPTDLLNIITIGYTIFFTWWTTTVNRNLQTKEGVLDQLAVQLMMVGAFVMCITMGDVFRGDYVVYFTALGLLRLLQVALLYRMYRINPEHEPKTKNIAHGVIIAGCIWIASGFVPAPYHFIAAGMALTLDVLIPLTKGKGNTVRLLNIHHLQERLGLFFMLVLGESMLVVALANSAATTMTALPYVVLSGLFATIVLWWLYFDYLEHCAHGRRPRHLLAYQQAHCLLFLALVVSAAGYKNLITYGGFTTTDVRLAVGGLAVALIAILLIRLALTTPYRPAVALLGGGAFAMLCLVAFGNNMPLLSFIGGGALFVLVGSLDRVFLRTAHPTRNHR